jgi:hypothetical protein
LDCSWDGGGKKCIKKSGRENPGKMGTWTTEETGDNFMMDFWDMG